ncbi:MAG: AbrB/MazE/SpoVT family DNA-binding domain-containing protein [Oscillospiraceae bacterium]
MGKKDDRYYMSSVKLGPKGQIVIPKEARAMFGLEPGHAGAAGRHQKGIALQTADKLNPLFGGCFSSAGR